MNYHPQKITDNSTVIRERVIKAREMQAERYKNNPGIYCNAQMSSKMLKEICVIDTVGQNLLKAAMEKLNLSARAYDRILKVSRTIADLNGSEKIKPEHLAEAIQYRSLDREGLGPINLFARFASITLPSNKHFPLITALYYFVGNGSRE